MLIRKYEHPIRNFNWIYSDDKCYLNVTFFMVHSTSVKLYGKFVIACDFFQIVRNKLYDNKIDNRFDLHRLFFSITGIHFIIYVNLISRTERTMKHSICLHDWDIGAKTFHSIHFPSKKMYVLTMNCSTDSWTIPDYHDNHIFLYQIHILKWFFKSIWVWWTNMFLLNEMGSWKPYHKQSGFVRKLYITKQIQ